MVVAKIVVAAAAAAALAVVASRGARLGDVERYYRERGDLSLYVMWKLATVVLLAALVLNARASVPRTLGATVIVVLALALVVRSVTSSG